MAKAKRVDVLAPVRAKPKSVKHLVLNPAALGHSKIEWEPVLAFPIEVLACANLESLDLFRGIAWDGDNRIPKEIGKLKKLKSLTLGGLTMKALPDSIGDLENLEELSLDYAESLESLPKTIGKLTKLKELSLSYTSALKSIPNEIGKLQKLTQLHLSETAIKTVPKELWKARGLRELSLPEGVMSLPPGISGLASLEGLLLSAKALASIAKELPKLKKLKRLALHQGEGAKLPEEVGTLPALDELYAPFTGLVTLPASLAGHKTLRSLDVSGNQLKDLEALVVTLPKLTELDFSDNKLDSAQKRRIDQLMRLSPSKRKANMPAPAAKGPKPTLLGRVASVNASLLMVVGDASTVSGWTGCEGDDYDRLCDVLGNVDMKAITIQKKKALALSLAVGQGIARIYQAGDRIVLVEGFLDNDKDATFLSDMGAPSTVKPSAKVEVPSGKLVIRPGTESDDGESLQVSVAKGTYDVILEKERNASWGSARRAIFTPS